MKAKDIKTLITSGTVLVAVALYLIFGQSPPTEEEYEARLAEEATQEQETTAQQETKQSTAIISLAQAEEMTGKKAQQVQYMSANDGDTFSIQRDGKKERVRLLMVDTPEMNYDKGEPMPYAEEAKAFTIGLLEKAERIELLFDKGPETDNYDRLLAYVYVDGVLLQEALLQEGYATMRYINAPNNTLEQPLRDIQKQAEQQQLNVWSLEGYVQNNRFNEQVKQ